MVVVRGHARMLLCVGGGGATKPCTHCKYRRLNGAIVEKRRYISLLTDDFVRLKFAPCV